jgi:hypothetical protein
LTRRVALATTSFRLRALFLYRLVCLSLIKKKGSFFSNHALASLDDDSDEALFNSFVLPHTEGKQANKKSAFFSSKVFRFGKNTLVPQKNPPSFMDNQMGKNDVNNDA